MSPIATPQITFRHAADAGRITEKQLRNWLDKGQVLLQGDSDREQGSWRRFSLVDVVRLAIFGAVLRHGVKIATACIILEDIDRGISWLARSNSASASQLLAALDGVKLAFAYLDAPSDAVTVQVAYTPSDTLQLDDLLAVTVVRVDAIARDVIARLQADDAEDDPSLSAECNARASLVEG